MIVLVLSAIAIKQGRRHTHLTEGILTSVFHKDTEFRMNQNGRNYFSSSVLSKIEKQIETILALFDGNTTLLHTIITPILQATF